ncbi:MAG TPA: ABC transporter substrate-binding protein [Candidatus Brachybacterium merdavium]|uniref:ABC transporter substrate-binding protein n=1 Tax=Candidatus Brachybacterium merdavium TaxID=2838513 RepID=A0A9D2LDN7_9MICO|nr:ABC transporter substrate-binding protein [Candidatus Brachybacterium merdavium]
MRFHLSRRAVMGGAAAATAAGLAGCLTNPADSSGDGDGGGSGGGAAGDGVVTILGNFGGVEADGFNAALESFQEDTGITVEYTSDQDFATTIRTRASAGDAPDIALFPQPGGLLDLAAEGHVAPISDYLDVDSLQSSLISGFLESATLEDQIYAAPMRMAVKSLVWYPTAAYEEGGWSTEPATLQELYGIAEEIKDSGIAPWADAWNADQSTGWVGTDWLEEFMLRIHGPEVYDQWTSHEIPFNDPRVVEALDHLGELLLTEGNVLGGSQTILNTEFSEASLPLFEDPPRAMLHRQGNFVTGFFPEDVQAELDEAVGVFALPAWEGGFDGVPMLGGGDLAALFAPDDDEAIQVMEFITSEGFGAEWAQAGGWLSPHQTFDSSQYADETTRSVAEIASSAEVFRFDGSDLMPGPVGGGSFWTAMVEWVNGDKTSQEACDDVEASWPE